MSFFLACNEAERMESQPSQCDIKKAEASNNIQNKQAEVNRVILPDVNDDSLISDNNKTKRN